MKDLLNTPSMLFYREYSLSGDYRHVVVQPFDVSWQLYRYDDVTIPLTLSDYDRLNKASEPKTIKGKLYLSP